MFRKTFDYKYYGVPRPKIFGGPLAFTEHNFVSDRAGSGDVLPLCKSAFVLARRANFRNSILASLEISLGGFCCMRSRFLSVAAGVVN